LRKTTSGSTTNQTYATTTKSDTIHPEYDSGD